jgi:hypothetical protein
MQRLDERRRQLANNPHYLGMGDTRARAGSHIVSGGYNVDDIPIGAHGLGQMGFYKKDGGRGEGTGKFRSPPFKSRFLADLERYIRLFLANIFQIAYIS